MSGSLYILEKPYSKIITESPALSCIACPYLLE